MSRTLAALLLLTPIAAAQKQLFDIEPKFGGWDYFGTSVARIGDVNGDGVTDLVVGIPRGGTEGHGEARVISGKGREVLRVVHGPGSDFGHAVCGTGDLNSDGVGDFAVGAPSPNGPETTNVRVFSGKTGAVIHVLETTANDDEFGLSVADVGDTNGDGFHDLVVGAPGRNGEMGAAYVYSGKTGNPWIVYTGLASGDRFGHDVAGVGDVNGDGRPDFALGIPGADASTTTKNVGYVRVYSGLSLSQLYTVSATSSLAKNGSEFGSSVTGLGDFDQDGGVDWAAGAPHYLVTVQQNHLDRGFVQVRSGSNATALQSFISGQDDQLFGTSVAGPGDLNGDGYHDLLVGAPYDTNTPGIAAAYRGGPVNTALFVRNGGAPGTRYGAAVAAVGDVDSDGYADLAVGAPKDGAYAENGGRVELISGKTYGVIDDVFPTSDHARFGAAVTFIGDVDQDDVPDVAVGLPGASFAGTNSGAVFFHSGADGEQILTKHGVAGDRFGAAIAHVGDVDGDGESDLAIGSPGANRVTIFPYSVLIDAGKVQIESYWPPNTIKTIWGEGAGDQLGFSLASGFDIDQDGVSDVIAGAPFADKNGNDSGQVVILSGVNGAKLLSVAGGGPGHQFGWAVDGLSDVDGDGVDDFVVGAPGVSGGLALGRAFIHSGATGAMLHQFAWIGGSRIGASVAGVGDLDGDGVEDVVVGAPETGITAGLAGAVYALSGATGSFLHVEYGDDPFDQLGSSVAGVGDVDNDGVPDFAAGAIEVYTFIGDKGSVRVWSGATFATLHTLNGDAIGVRFGAAIAGGGDLDGDRIPDLLVGKPYADVAGNDSGEVDAFSLVPIGLQLYGAGTDGCDGPQIMSGNRSPKVGAGDFVVSCTHAPANGAGFFLFGGVADVAGSDPFGVGVLLHVDLALSVPPIIFAVTSNAKGVSTVALPIAANPALAGYEFHVQTVWSWTGVCALPPANLGASNGLKVTILP